MNELRRYLNFTQVRLHCKKQEGRRFHITTLLNSAGEAAVQFLSGQTDVMPLACGSYFKMNDDDSSLSTACDKWGKESGNFLVGKWGIEQVIDHGTALGLPENRLFDHTAFVEIKYHWLLGLLQDRWECDDYLVGVTSGDFWKVFVR